MLEHLQNRRPEIVHVGCEVHAEQCAHQNEQRQPPHLDQHVARLAVLPRRRDLIGVVAEQIDVGGQHLFVQRRLHGAAQLIVLGAVGDQHAFAQILRHRIGGDAPAELIALFDQQEAAGLRAGEHDRVEAQQVETEGIAQFGAEDFQRGE